MVLEKRTEYYVSFFDTENRYSYSSLFTSKEKAEDFLKSVLSLGAKNAKIKEQSYLYETG